jgi:hypothetical protein
MKTQMAGALSRREAEIMVLFGDDTVALTCKEISELLRENFGHSTPGEGSVIGRVNALVAAGRLVHLGDRTRDRKQQLQQPVGLPRHGQ